MAQATINWDEWGVPHIQGKNDEELMFAEGWAQMQLHGNLITELYGRARGRGAEYWGKSRLQEDMFIHTLGFPELAAKWTAEQDPEYKRLLTAFVKGLNAYVQAFPETVRPENRIVLPLTTTDANAHAIFVLYGRFVGGGEMEMNQDWREMGSNTWAIAPSRSASHNAMLIQNPHLPWQGEFLFTELHLMKPGKNMYGSSLVGLPGIAIGFNENLGWSHTNNTIDNADTYEVTLQDDGYLLDGVKLPFQVKNKMLLYKDENGQMKEEKFVIRSTLHGPLVGMGKKKALAIRMPGYDRPNAGLQWWHMINANSFQEFEAALKMAQIPFFNVMYADKAGNIFYLFNGLVPKRREGDWEHWNKVVPGDKSADIWNEVHSYAELPKLKNPSTGWLQNTNDPPWSSTYPFAINSADFPAYMSPHVMDYRNQRSIRMLMEDESITFDELMEYKLSTRMELADRILDDLFQAIDLYGTPISKSSKDVLSKWDRKADAGSSGAVLFARWAERMNTGNPAMYSVKWNEKDPLHTPKGLADPKTAVRELDSATLEVIRDHGKADISWGDVVRIHSQRFDLPGNGSSGGLGVFRVAWSGMGKNHKQYIGGGDSWVGLIEFGKKVRARVLLSYGNSSQQGNEHNGDQLKFFSEKKMRTAYFYPKDVDAHRVRKERMKGKVFAERK